MMNVEKAFKTGIESTFHWQFTPKYKNRISDGVYLCRGFNDEKSAPKCTVGFPLVFHCRFQSCESGAEYRFVSEQSRIDKAFGELETPSFNLFDIDLTYDVFKNAVLIGSVSNIFDKPMQNI